MRLIKITCLLLLSTSLFAQNSQFTHQDSLRGSITPERIWWDLSYYHLTAEVDIQERYIKGTNLVKYQVLSSHQKMQIDLQQPMKITKVIQNGKNLNFIRDGNAYFITLKAGQNKGDVNELLISFEGKPTESKNPPWSGGFTWKKDTNGMDFIATSCQGDGASMW